jgi:hypothetical protein
MWHHDMSALVYLRDGGHPDDDNVLNEEQKSAIDQNAID